MTTSAATLPTSRFTIDAHAHEPEGIPAARSFPGAAWRGTPLQFIDELSVGDELTPLGLPDYVVEWNRTKTADAQPDRWDILGAWNSRHVVGQVPPVPSPVGLLESVESLIQVAAPEAVITWVVASRIPEDRGGALGTRYGFQLQDCIYVWVTERTSEAASQRAAMLRAALTRSPVRDDTCNVLGAAIRRHKQSADDDEIRSPPDAQRPDPCSDTHPVLNDDAPPHLSEERYL